MPSTWILVADRSGARLLTAEGQQKPRVLETFANPEGRLQDREVDSDRPGRAFDSVGSARHAAEPQTSPTQTIANEFARKLASRLERGRTEHSFDKLVLVADAKFLGLLRQELGKDTARLVTASLDKNLSGMSDGDVLSHIAPLLKTDATAAP